MIHLLRLFGAAVALILVATACGEVTEEGDPDASTAPTFDATPGQPDSATGPDATPCAGTIDDCGVCNGNNLSMDCAGVCDGAAVEDMCDTCDADPDNDCVQDCNGVWGGDARLDMCSVCDANPNNDCVQDCAGNWGGNATVDGCGTCDTNPNNDCWVGTHSTMTINESANFNLGSGTLTWSISGGDRGYFYAGNFTNPEATIAYVINQSACSSSYSGYTGLNTVQSLTDAASLAYTVPNPTIMFGDRTGLCNMGLLVFKQGSQYGVIDFLSINANQQLTIEYWLGGPGVTDFSNAP